jgi:hypothetical protein
MVAVSEVQFTTDWEVWRDGLEGRGLVRWLGSHGVGWVAMAQ